MDPDSSHDRASETPPGSPASPDGAGGRLPVGASAEEGATGLLLRCREQGLAEEQAADLAQVDPHAILQLEGQESRIASRAMVVFAALGRGNLDLADQALALDLPVDPQRPEQRLLDLSARLYRACVGAERDPSQPQAVMNALTEALLPVLQLQTAEARLARGYAGLTFSEALLRVGDVGAARQQLESVADEAGMPPGITVIAGMLLGGIEQAVGRSDLALGHIQLALHRATQLGVTSDEERLLRLILVALLLADSKRLGLAMLDDVRSGKYGAAPSGHGTVARLYHLLSLIASSGGDADVPSPSLGSSASGSPAAAPGGSKPPGTLAQPVQPGQPEDPHVVLLRRLALNSELSWLQGRHNSAGWSLLLASMSAGALSGMGDQCGAYGVLVEAAADLRCRYMDGVADLCDRQIAMLRHQLGPDAFEGLIAEAQRRRHELRVRRLAMQTERLR